MQREAIDAIAPRGFQDIKEHLVPRLHRSGGTVRAYAASVPTPRVADLHSYLAVNHWMVQRDTLARRPGSELVADASAVIHPGALIVGPVIVGARSRIDAGAVIVGPAVIGAGCVVESGALVSRSVLAGDGIVRAHAVVHSSIFGEGALLEEGAQLYGGVRLATTRRRSWMPRLFGGATGRRPPQRHNVPAAGVAATRPAPELPTPLANHGALHASEHN
jgi:NDP-sugar pyrophosphorylase family protein